MLPSVATVFFADLISKIFLAIAALLLIRVLSPAEYASYTAAAAVFAVVIQAAGAAFSRVYLVTRGAEFGTGQAAVFLVAQLIAAFAIALMGALAVSLPVLLLVGTIWLSLAGCCTDFLKTVYQSQLKFTGLSVVELVRSAAFMVTIVVALAILHGTLQAWLVIALQAAAFSAASVPLLRVVRQGQRDVGALRPRQLFAQITSRPLVYLVGYFLALSVLSSIDVFMLRAASDDFSVATYGSAFRYYSLILVALYSLNTVMFPVLQKAANVEAVRAVFRRHRLVVLVSMPVILALALSANDWIPLIDGGKYSHAPAVFRILAASAAISILCSPWVNIFLIAGRYRELLLLVLLALVTAVVTNVLLIPTMRAEGAAIATLCASGVLNMGIALRSQAIRAVA